MGANNAMFSVILQLSNIKWNIFQQNSKDSFLDSQKLTTETSL